LPIHIVTQDVWFQVVPTDASKLPDFQKIIKCTSDFETDLKELMFISPSDDKDNRLSNFAENVEVHFAFKKKTEILAKARNLLLQCDFSIPQVSFHFSDWENSSVAVSICCCWWRIFCRSIQGMVLFGRMTELLSCHPAMW
jgi:hypothetical protein